MSMVHASITLLIILAAEALSGALAISDRLLLGLSLHLAACVVLAAFTCRRFSAPTPVIATVQLTALLLPFIGPLAALSGIVVLIIAAARHDPAANAAMWHEHLFPNLAADELTEQAEAINRRQPGNEAAGEIESFYDVLRWGTLPEQEHVLSLISRSFRPEFAPVLRAGLAVDDLGLRAQAAAGLSLLESRISARLSGLQERQRLASDDTRSQASILLAQALADAAHSGLYDEARVHEMRAEIISVLEPLAQIADADPTIRTILGRTLIQLGQVDRAVDLLSTSDGPGEQADAAFAWLLEGCFEQGDYARIDTLLARRVDRVSTIVRKDGPLAPALQFWGQPA